MVTTHYKLKFNKNHFEERAWGQNQLICGIDEVGRGCLAGPVMVGAVILHPNKKSRLVKDSKLMTAQEREKAYKWIIRNSWHSVALVHNRTIDNHNIYQATLEAMKRAFLQLMQQAPTSPSTIVVDAMPLQLKNTAYQDLEIYHFPFGEKRSSSIAAASIVAKVTRDRLMASFDKVYNGYDFNSHKGYATPHHKKHVQNNGYTVIHRLNFLRGWGLLPKESNENENQQSLF